MNIATTANVRLVSAPEAPVPEADSVLLTRIASRDRQALAELYSRHQRPLFRYLWQLTQDAGLAEEVLQDTLVAAWNGAASFEGRSTVRTWLFGISRRQAYNVLRRRGIELASEDALVALEDPEPGPEARVLQQSDAEEIQRALGRLPVIHREVLVLNFINGLRYEEIASVLGVPEGTVKSRLSNAKRGLRNLLAHRADGDQATPSSQSNFRGGVR